MAIKFLDTILSGSLKVSGSYTLPIIDTGSTGFLGQIGINGEVPYFFNSSSGWQAVSGSKPVPAKPVSANVEYLIVAGGGGAAKGGGGAGGYLSSSLSNILSGSTITVTVGAGGTGIQGSGQGTTANQGGSSSLASSEFSTIVAIGGGGGAIAYYGVGGDGGSGGGGAGLDATGDGDGGSGTAGQGFDGGDGKYTTSHGGLYAMGGGGGASEVGSDGQNSTVNGSTKNGGDGGDGKQSKITGTLTYYAGGGGGGVHGDSTGYVTGDGGQGGGADAADQPGSNGQNAGNAGTANTGGGGGGAASLVSYSGQTGGQGGSGVVILAYPTGSVTAKGGRISTRTDGQFVHTFNSSGTLSFGGSSFNTVAPGDNFNTVLYTGNSSTSNAISGVGFQPDLVWWKARTDTRSQNWSDSLRGAGKLLFSNNTDAQYSATDRFISFDSDGFTVGSSDNYVNNASHNYVAWCWKGGDLGTAAEFNGTNSYITTSLYLGANWNATAWTISFWAKADVAGDDYAFGTSNATGMAISFRGVGSVYLISGNNTAITYTVGEWKHFVYTHNGSGTTKGYGNGTLEDTNTSVASHFSSTDPLTIGRYGLSSAGYFDGQIANIRVYNAELNASQVTQLYQETDATSNTLNFPTDAGCVAHYLLESGVTDTSGNYNGTAQGTITYTSPGRPNLNFEGDIVSTVSVNSKGGFSIVKWDATTTVSHTVGHGLSAKPRMIIMKNASTSSRNWFVYTDILDGSLDYLYLNSTAVKANSTRNVPTSTVFDQGNLGGVSAGNDCIAYCFHDVAGYQKIGTYEGTGTSGNTVSLDFKATFIMIKNVDDSGGWFMLDSVRDTDGTLNKYVFANSTAAEATASTATVTPNDTGFEIGNSNSTHLNSSGDTFIFLAIA
tara:strand:+ start:1707 stop:4376 length:2670 start_codon:yes stop_codon:yes gene_type:complete